jgi:hypothetical protein
MHPQVSSLYELQANVTIHQQKFIPIIIGSANYATFHTTYNKQTEKKVLEKNYVILLGFGIA